MDLKIERYGSHEKSTLGTISIDGKLFCWSLEDKVRETDAPVAEWKIKGHTAIPRGTYKVVIDFSNRFQRPLPHVLDVPGFGGIRIHPGNSDVDTEGCLLVGGKPTGDDWIPNSRATFAKLFSILEAAESRGEEIELEVC